MTRYPHSIIDSLRVQHQQLSGAHQARLLWLRASLEEAIRALDEKWGVVERKHERSLRESTSAAWTDSLRSLQAERKRKNDEARSQLLAQLQLVPSEPATSALDTQGIEAELSAIDEEISKFRETLSVRRRQTEFLGDYGEIDDEKWIREIARFVNRNPNVSRIINRFALISTKSGLTVDWPSVIAQRVNELIEPAITLPDVAPSDGSSFEHACLLALHNSGWSATLTPSTGDQGVDILAKKNGISVAIQCKNYRAPVGNGAVQEVHAGRSFYEANVAVVVSLSGYTPSASLLAQKLRVLLLDHISLERLEDLL
jgi:hypothetical protein